MSIKTKFLATTTSLALLFSVPAFADQRNIDVDTQASIKLAESFYQDVLVYRNLDNFSKYVGDVYTQHATAYGDGPEQMLAAVTHELNADPGVQVDLYRTIAEGPYVAIQSVWTASSGEEHVYVDIWRRENGVLMEHWDHFQQVPEESANKNTMYQGPGTDIYTANQDVERNRERAIAVLNSFENPADTSAVTDYVSAEEYIQHNPNVPDGRDALIGYLDSIAQSNTRLEVEIAKTIAMGDMVLVHSKQTNLDTEDDLGFGYMDIFRFNDEGQIVEHWDIEEAQTGESANDNDVFGYSDN
ncbi:nuclear transport factor 2 family protein [Pseudovibrio sp. Tun.PSC04-5.I4]|uniref:nuclear transport factor 2 family protein n=1 Tax=Pseudovibrio sp. Tun.PSC04-5.I4 TaxID=1798213 RepID=UPI00087FB420|nr:nuclear transport factor 2 family protein [Pseudovibrio sp. Tun.PSC04-5.I4]SDR19556.1 Predicted SnoaL-like aldol condensation-catalyzing enzyme [Pseudovibrio sp. Tun.PSC04-5.I4]